MMDLKADLAIFFSPADFGDEAVIQLPGGDLPITGNGSVYAERERPGSNTNSGIGAFMVGAADLNLRRAQFMTAWLPVATAVPECRLTIPAGDLAGTWRVREIQRDGDIARLILNAE